MQKLDYDGVGHLLTRPDGSTFAELMLSVRPDEAQQFIADLETAAKHCEEVEELQGEVQVLEERCDTLNEELAARAGRIDTLEAQVIELRNAIKEEVGE